MDKEKLWSSFKVSLELKGEKRISGSNLFEILEGIMLKGSISSAASSLGFSYRYAWGLIREAEGTMGIQLVEKQVGGREGGGTTLTDEGRELLFSYGTFKEEINSKLKKLVDEKYQNRTPPGRHLLLASTMEPVETGLLDLLEQAFYQDTNILVRHIALGSGRALEIAREGRVDMTLTHAPDLEEKFVNEGWGLIKSQLMTNDFIVIGPPAGIISKDIDVVELFRRIVQTESLFISRRDQSGTHLREQKIWEAAKTYPAESCYLFSSGVAGNLGVIRLAAEKGGFALVDRASYILSGSHCQIYTTVESSYKNSELMKNTFILTLVNPDKFPGLNYREALLFSEWLRDKGRSIIEDFGTEKFGEPLFYLP